MVDTIFHEDHRQFVSRNKFLADLSNQVGPGHIVKRGGQAIALIERAARCSSLTKDGVDCCNQSLAMALDHIAVEGSCSLSRNFDAQDLLWVKFVALGDESSRHLQRVLGRCIERQIGHNLDVLDKLVQLQADCILLLRCQHFTRFSHLADLLEVIPDYTFTQFA